MPTDRRDVATIVLVPGLLALLVVAGATVGFSSLFLDGAWLAPTATAVVGGVGLVTLWRLLGVPRVPRLVLTLALGAAWVMAWFPLTAGVPWTSRPAVLGDGLSLARQEIAQQVAPTPFLTGISLVVVAGAFVVAVVVAELLARRLVLSALMVALVLWVVPLTIPLPDRRLAVLALAFAVPAGLALALVDDPSVGSGTSSWPRRARGLAVALAVAVLAVPLAIVTPGHGGPPVFDLRGLGATIEGYEPIVDVGDQLRLPDSRTVLEVRTNRPAYLRTAALEVFDGRRWRVGESLEDTEIPPSAQEDASDGIGQRRRPDGPLDTYEIDAIDLPNVYLPVPNRPVRVAPTGGSGRVVWSSVGDFAATESMEAMLALTDEADYVAEVALPAPDYDDLAAIGEVEARPSRASTLLPAPVPDLAQLARDVTAAADATTTVDQVLAIQQYLGGPDTDFTYSTDVPELRGDTALQDFVFTTQTGYCEYFATAMAVMLRTLDVPTRVATGYLPGEEVVPPGPDGEPGTYRVSSTDAHAWVEVHFPDDGWVTFDPTPRGDTAGLRPDAADLTPFAALRGGGPQDIPRGFTGENPLGDIDATDPDDQQAGNTGALGRGGGTGVASTAWWIAAAIVVLLGALVAVAWWRGRRVPTADDPTEAGLLALSHLLVGAAALGRGRRRSETLRELATRWVVEDHVDTAAADRVAELGGRAAFGSALSADEAHDLRTTCAAVAEHLRDHATLREKVLSTPRQFTARP